MSSERNLNLFSSGENVEEVTEDLIEELTQEENEDEQNGDSNVFKPSNDFKPSNVFKPSNASSDEAINKSEAVNRLLQELQRCEVNSMRLVDGESDCERLRNENERFQVRLGELVEQNELRRRKDDEIIAAVNQRVEQWKAVFVTKETTIMQQQNEIEKLKQSLSVNNSTHNTNTISLLTKALKEKELEVSKLSSELRLATEELLISTRNIEELRESTVKDDDYYKKQLQLAKRNISVAENVQETLNQHLKDAEKTTAKKEKELAEVLAQLKAYEMSEFGLADAVQEIKHLKQQLNIRDKQIEELTLAADQLELALGNVKDENDRMANKLGLSLGKQQLNDVISGFHQSPALANHIKKRIVGDSYEPRLVEPPPSSSSIDKISHQVRLLQDELKELKNVKISSLESAASSSDFDLKQQNRVIQLKNESKTIEHLEEKKSYLKAENVDVSIQTDEKVELSCVERLNLMINSYQQRKCLYLMESESQLRRKLLTIENEMSRCCSSKLNRIRYLEQLKQMMFYKVESMNRWIEEGLVSKSQLKWQEKVINQLLEQRDELLKLLKYPTDDVLDIKTALEASDESKSVEDEWKAEKCLLLNELNRLKQTNEIAENQLNDMKLFNLSKNLEVENLRRQLIELNENDDRQLNRKLYMELLNLQLSEMKLKWKLESCEKQALKIETFSLRLEQICDEKEHQLHRVSLMSWNQLNRAKMLTKQTLIESGERKVQLALTELNLRADRERLDEELERMNEKKKRLSLKEIELRNKITSLDFELKTLKSSKEVSGFLNQSSKLTELRIQNEKHLYELQRVNDQFERGKLILKQKEGKINELQEEITSLKTNQWQNDVIQMDKQLLLNVQNTQQYIIDEKTLKKDEKPAKMNFKQHSVELKEKQEQIKRLLKSEKEALRRVEELEIGLNARNQVLASLKNQNQNETEHVVMVETNTKVNECVVETLNLRLRQKEETLNRYKHLLEIAQREMLSLAENEKEERSKMMNEKFISVVETKSLKMKDVTCIKSSEQMNRLNELEEITTQQDNAIVILAEKLKTSSKEIQKLRIEMENLLEIHEKDKQKLTSEFETDLLRIKSEIDESRRENEELRVELKDKVSSKRSNEGLNLNLNRNVAEQLRIKDKEIQSLSRAIVSLNEKMKILVVEAKKVNQNECQSCLTAQKEIEILRKKLKGQDAVEQQMKKLQVNLERQLVVCGQLKKENTRLQCKLNDKLKPELNMKELSGEKETKLKLELNEASKRVNQLNKQVEILKQKLKKVNTSEDEGDKVELNVKIKVLMDEIDELMRKVKEAHFNKQEGAGEDFELILSREADLRREIDNLHKENADLRSEMRVLRDDSVPSEHQVKWLKEKLSVGVLSDSLTAKMIEHNDKLLINYHREVKTNEKLKVEMHLAELEIQRLTQLLTKHKII
ncbi:hypothetical protein CHUAL_006020 [Chamberlinius hualienensis]